MSDRPADVDDVAGGRLPDGDDDSTDRLARLAARTADEKKAEDIIVLQVGDVLGITEYFVIASASNVRLVRTVADEIEAAIKSGLGRPPVRVEGQREAQWVLIDYGDVVVHVFHDETREFYGIERLYGDVGRLDWRAA
ncbi:MAG: ribosome silencing factor [Actinomycetota bacterium]